MLQPYYIQDPSTLLGDLLHKKIDMDVFEKMQVHERYLCDQLKKLSIYHLQDPISEIFCNIRII